MTKTEFLHRKIADVLSLRNSIHALAIIFLATPVIGDPIADVNVSIQYYDGISSATIADTSTQSTGTTSRAITSSSGISDLSSQATATTSSTGSTGVQTQIDVARQSGPAGSTYNATATSRSIVPWVIESATLAAGTEVTVDVIVNLDGMLSIDFPSNARDLSYDFLTPGTMEGTFTHANTGIDMNLRVNQVSNNASQNAFNVQATLDVDGGLITDPLDAGLFTDLSCTSCPSDVPASASSLRYGINHHASANVLNWEEVVFRVGEVYELDLFLGTSSSLGLNIELPDFLFPDFVFTLTSGFANTASYDLAAGSGEDITFRSLAAETVIPVPAAVWLFGSGLIGLVAIARRRKR